MSNDKRQRPWTDQGDRGYDESFRDQRNPQPGMANRPRHWQGKGSGEQGRYHDEPRFDQRHYGGGNQYGRAGEYSRRQDVYRPDDDFERGRHGDYPGDYRGDPAAERWEQPGWAGREHFGRGNETIRQEPQPGVHMSEQPLRSRSADPGQSSYGGFSNEDPRFQQQQMARYSGGRGYPQTYEGAAQGGQQVGWRSERQQYGGYQGSPQRMQRTLPKGYVRSDDRILEDVCERLSESGMDVSAVSVQVKDGCVTLEGQVHDRRSKHDIEYVVDDCLGVKDVENRIRVQPAAPGGA